MFLYLARMTSIELSLNNAADVTSTGYQIEVLPAVTVSSIVPSTGTVVGGTAVTVLGQGFTAGHGSCRFGSLVVDAQVLSSTESRCVTPASMFGEVQFDYLGSFGSGDETMPDSGLTFTVRPVLAVDSIQPTRVSMAGGSDLTLSTPVVTDSDNVQCRFDSTIIVDARKTGSGVTVCSTPAMPESRNYTLEASINGQVWNALVSVDLEFVPESNVSAVAPSRIVTGSMTDVSITGVFSNMQAFCSIGDQADMLAPPMSVLSTPVSSSVIRCTIMSRGEGFKAVKMQVAHLFTHDEDVANVRAVISRSWSM